MSASALPLAGPKGMADGIRQIYQETDWEKKCRHSGNFPEIEAKMPLLPRKHQAPYLDRFSSLLGEKNPFAKPIDSNEHTIWLFDNTAYRVEGTKDQWKVEAVAAYFYKDSGDGSSEVVGKISEVIGVAKDDKARERIAQRIQPFLDSVLQAHTSVLELEGQKFKLGPSSSSGISSDVVKFKSKSQNPQSSIPKIQTMTLPVPATTFFADTTGWAVISDIDDTIKKTLTSTALGVLQSTFVEDPEPIAGMPEFYKYMSNKLETPPFWYLSASPYNLYVFLKQFLNEVKYPPGMVILRDASWMSMAGLLASVTQGTQAYKTDRMRKIHSWFPKRTFICIGDSTQTDPESYGQMFRENPEWIKAIFIRKVVGVSQVDMDKEKNDPKRFEKAFEDVPDDVWHVFEDPKELYERIDKLKEAGFE
jgi:phosphatidate phosphatase APP1